MLCHGSNDYVYYLVRQKLEFESFEISIYDSEFEVIRNFIHKKLFVECFPIDVYKSFLLAEKLLNNRQITVFPVND